MLRRTFAKSLGLLLAGAAVWASLGLAAAQQGQSQGQGQGKRPTKVQGRNPGETIITDAAGRVHVYHARITDAQRKAVAARMTAAKARKGGKAK